MDGFMPQVKPDDDHLVHLQIEDAFMESRGQTPGTQPIPPQGLGIFMQHMQMHIQAARQDANYWKQYGTQILPFEAKVKQTLAAIQKQQQGAQAAQGAVAHLRGGGVMPPGGMPGGGPPGGPPGMPAGMSAGGTPPNLPSLPQPGMPSAGVPPGPNGANGGLPS
jgi:hypothetical protein